MKKWAAWRPARPATRPSIAATPAARGPGSSRSRASPGRPEEASAAAATGSATPHSITGSPTAASAAASAAWPGWPVTPRRVPRPGPERRSTARRMNPLAGRGMTGGCLGGSRPAAPRLTARPGTVWTRVPGSRTAAAIGGSRGVAAGWPTADRIGTGWPVRWVRGRASRPVASGVRSLTLPRCAWLRRQGQPGGTGVAGKHAGEPFPGE